MKISAHEPSDVRFSSMRPYLTQKPIHVEGEERYSFIKIKRNRNLLDEEEIVVRITLEICN